MHVIVRARGRDPTVSPHDINQSGNKKASALLIQTHILYYHSGNLICKAVKSLKHVFGFGSLQNGLRKLQGLYLALSNVNKFNMDFFFNL